MKSSKRAERRRNNARLYKKRRKEELVTCFIGDGTDISREIEWAEWRARKRLNTNVLCSCPMCASPRKLHGNGEQGLTQAEKRQKETYREELEEA